MMDMLTFSKEREPDLVPGDLNEVVGDVVELVKLAPARSTSSSCGSRPTNSRR